MDWTILWWLLAGLIVAAGLAGTVVPALGDAATPKSPATVART